MVDDAVQRPQHRYRWLARGRYPATALPDLGAMATRGLQQRCKIKIVQPGSRLGPDPGRVAATKPNQDLLRA